MPGEVARGAGAGLALGRLVLGRLVLGGLALGVLAGCSSTASPAPPPLGSPGPGVFRVYAGTSQSVPMNYTAETLSGGTKINIGIGPTSVHTMNGKLSAYFGLQYPGEPTGQAPGGFWLSPGQSHVVGGRYRFTVLRIWHLATAADDAADVQITSVS
jgi:hypothetical protein